MGRVGKYWRGLEPGDDFLTTCDETHASQRYLQAAEDLRWSSWYEEQIFDDRESFLLQRKCAMSELVEIIFFRAWLIILVWENEPKLKETTVNYFELRHHQWIEEYTRDNSELVNQDARMYVGIGSLVCIVNLLVAPVANVLMRLGCQGKGTEDFSRQWLSSNLETLIVKAILVPGNSFLFW